MNIVVLCVYRNASSYLAEFVEHLHPWVDKFLFLDDRSTPDERDRATGMVYARLQSDIVIQRRSRWSNQFIYETRNRQILLSEAQAEGADWVLCLDADERLELQFLKDMRGICEGATVPAYSVQVRDLWNTPMQYRVDGIWNTKRKEILFDLRDGYITPRPGLHHPWVFATKVAYLGYNLYHLGSLTPELRAERVERHQSADPQHKWQADYNYLADETGLLLEQMPAGKDWR